LCTKSHRISGQCKGRTKNSVIGSPGNVKDVPATLPPGQICLTCFTPGVSSGGFRSEGGGVGSPLASPTKCFKTTSVKFQVQHPNWLRYLTFTCAPYPLRESRFHHWLVPPPTQIFQKYGGLVPVGVTGRQQMITPRHLI
jgi:hypothetical protein